MTRLLFSVMLIALVASCGAARSRDNKKRLTIGSQITVMTEKPCTPTDSLATIFNMSDNPYIKNKELAGYKRSTWIFSESVVNVEEVAKDTSWVKVHVVNAAARQMIGCTC